MIALAEEVVKELGPRHGRGACDVIDQFVLKEFRSLVSINSGHRDCVNNSVF